MGLIALIISLVRAIPEAIALVKVIIDIIRQLKGRPMFNEAAVRAELKAAIKEATEKKDVTRLDLLYSRLRAHCTNGVCEPLDLPAVPGTEKP